jgi:hypothetical protein
VLPSWLDRPSLPDPRKIDSALANATGRSVASPNGGRTRFASALVVAAIFTMPAGAQWLNYKTPGIPRTADGKPDLSAPAPRTANGKPDLSGLWRTDGAKLAGTSKAMESLKPQPWAVALSEKRKENLTSDSPGVLCLPPGPFGQFGSGQGGQTPYLYSYAFRGHLISRGLPGRP